MHINHIPTKLFHLESTDSTNNYIANLVQVGEIESGSVVLADYQTQGRGQRGTKWQGLAGENMTASLFLKWTGLHQSDQFRISMLVALGIERFLAGYGLDSLIKWPNDLWVDGKKIAGILIENQLRGENVYSSIIGIGFNINQVDFEEGLNATSLSLLYGKTFSVRLITLELFQTIGQVINAYHQYPFEHIAEQYLEKLFGFGEKITVQFTRTASFHEIEITGVSRDGKLAYLVEGRPEKADLKDIRFIPK
jgi:BirA family transcriptional regulator, biotin operon repressor / biotin---[acetyl-CoA-carboxylase] ligase